jgi:hypothetical protein
MQGGYSPNAGNHYGPHSSVATDSIVPILTAVHSEKTIMLCIKNGELEGMQDGGVLRVTTASIKRYIERNRIESEDDHDVH